MSYSERRKADRLETRIEASVKGRESEDKFWKEEIQVVTVSKIGAGFYLRRKVDTGRLVALNIELPHHLRQYDEDKKRYRVWGLVQHSNYNETKDSFHTGIAFIGKNAPSTYIDQPTKTYRVVGLDADGFWNVGETKEPFVTRRYHRFSEAIPVKISIESDSDKRIKMDWDAVTENVSAGGASIFSNLEVEVGDAVKFTTQKPEYESIAVVRNIQQRENGRQTIHIQFTEPDFPVLGDTFTDVTKSLQKAGEEFEQKTDTEPQAPALPDQPPMPDIISNL